jgi:Mrp family chromosome partitioning ATPase
MLKKKKSGGIKAGGEALLANFSTKSHYAEAYRTLRTNVSFALMDRELNSLVITSSLQGEGKTTTVANLAHTIALTGKTVLMVDADLRKPGLSARFGQTQAGGFTSLVADVLGRQVKSGELEAYGIADLIRLNRLQQRTCLLAIASSENQIELQFLKGELVDIHWRTRPDQKKLASVLVEEKLLSQEDAELALGQQKRSVRRLGAILLSMGLLEARELRRILALQTMEAFRVAEEMGEANFTIRTLAAEEIGQPDLDSSGGSLAQMATEMLPESGSSYIRDHIAAHIVATEQENLFLLPSGKPPPNPSELIGSAHTVFLLNHLKSRYDVVLIDSSPILPASDALLLAPQVDGVVLVVEAGKTNRNILRDATQQLRNAQAKILGVLLNRADLSQGDYYRYYKSYYGQ